jgi:alkylhydroperoxidase family enzyme
MLALEAYVKECGLEHRLYELVKTCASQINGCAYCRHMNTRAPDADDEEARRHFTEAAALDPLRPGGEAVGPANADRQRCLSSRRA